MANGRDARGYRTEDRFVMFVAQHKNCVFSIAAIWNG
jgi:hypothetical protein